MVNPTLPENPATVGEQKKLPTMLVLHEGMDGEVLSRLSKMFSARFIDLQDFVSADDLSAYLDNPENCFTKLDVALLVVPTFEYSLLQNTEKNVGDLEVDAVTENSINQAWLDTRFAAIFSAAQFFSRHMMGQERGGSVVFLQSVVADVGHPQAANTSVLAGATLGLMKSLAKEVARYSVSVNVIAVGSCPELGWQVPMDEDYRQMFSATGLGQAISAETLSGSIQFVQQAAMAFTGQVLRVDGGLVI